LKLDPAFGVHLFRELSISATFTALENRSLLDAVKWSRRKILVLPVIRGEEDWGGDSSPRMAPPPMIGLRVAVQALTDEINKLKGSDEAHSVGH
jgi:hypothetical protein